MQKNLGEFKEHKWDKGKGIENLFFFFPSSFVIVRRIQIQTKTKPLFSQSGLCSYSCLPCLEERKKKRRKLLLLTRSFITALKLLLISWMLFPFTLITGKYWPWVLWTCICEADDADRMNHTGLHFHLIHMSFELGRFHTSYPEFRPWKIELLVEL